MPSAVKNALITIAVVLVAFLIYDLFVKKFVVGKIASIPAQPVSTVSRNTKLSGIAERAVAV